MAALDKSSGTTGPATQGFAITPGDGSDLAIATRALWVGGAGDVKVTTLGGDTVILVGVTAGSLIPIRVSRVFSTSTTATSIVGLY
jgi:hypothetical protein